MQLLAGTSGYSYKEWKGPFYPDDLAPREMLGYYAERLPAVEINNTFYRLPKASVLETWSSQVGDAFRFSIKASRRITHFKRLKETQDETGYLLETLESLGDKLGSVLFQLPPNLKCDVARLEAFLELLPTDTPAAFEFRHESWDSDEVSERLAARNAARVIVDDDDDPEAPPDAALPATADWGYLRLRRAGYARGVLAQWAARVAATDWKYAFVFFKHEDAGAGPRLAADFIDVAARAAERRGPATRRPEQTERETA